MKAVQFFKMHGIGNDYVYVDALRQPVRNPAEVAKIVAPRHTGIGSDGLVLILPSSTGDFRMQMFNADGSEGKMCGNAIRCVGKYLYDSGHTKKTSLSIETASGSRRLTLIPEGGVIESVDVDMGEPIWESARIPVLSGFSETIDQPLHILGRDLRYTAVSVGNPHAVFFVDEITDELVLSFGPAIERLPLFPERVNVEFVEVHSPTELRMRVWERGSGETMACGTGATAVLAAAARTGRSNRAASVRLLGGDLRITWGEDNRLWMLGPATFVFSGTIELPNEYV